MSEKNDKQLEQQNCDDFNDAADQIIDDEELRADIEHDPEAAAEKMGLKKKRNMKVHSEIRAGVLGKGPIPTFAPPYVPVGPIVVGDLAGETTTTPKLDKDKS